jgi:hypothetical protein
LVGEVKPNCSPTIIAELIGIWLMFCMPPATMTSAVPDMIGLGAKGNGELSFGSIRTAGRP